MPVATAKMFGSKMMSSAGKPAVSVSSCQERRQISSRRSTFSAWPCSSKAITITAAPWRRISRAWCKNASSPSFRLIEFTTDLPCRHFKPVSITDHFEESTITGTREMSGSPATRSRKVCMAASESSMPSSMFTSMTWAPLSTCWRATSSAPLKSPASISLRKRAEPVTLVRSPTFTNSESSSMLSGSRPLRRQARGRSGGQRGDVFRTGAAATSHQVHEAAVGKLADQRRHGRGVLVVAAEGVRQAGIRMHADEGVGEPGKLRDMRAQLLGPQRAVETRDQRARVADAVPESLDRLSRQGAAGGVGDGARDHHRQAEAVRLEQRLQRVDR